MTTVVSVVLITVLAIGLTTVAPPLDAQNVIRPNVLVIVTDDQRLDLLAEMPKTLKWMDKQGTSFSNAFTPVPRCCPARASIFTGQYVHNHGVKTNKQGQKLDQRSTIQRYLQEAGYHTGLVGKYLNSWPVDSAPPYFSEWALGKIGAGHRRSNYFGSTWNVDGEFRKVRGYATRFIKERSLAFLAERETRDDKPWFLYVAPAAPHDPALPEKKYEDLRAPSWPRSPAIAETDRSDKPSWVQAKDLKPKRGKWLRRNQIRTLRSVDDMVGSLMGRLRGNGELRDTLVIFTSDNGYLLGEHGLLTKSYPYTETIAVPLLARWPGRFVAGETDDRLVSLVDIAPTIIDAADISLGMVDRMDGRSLLSRHRRNRLLIELETRDGYRSWASTRTRTSQYVEHYDQDGHVLFREFYDVDKDPAQLNNLFSQIQPSVTPDIEVLASVLGADRRCSGDSCP